MELQVLYSSAFEIMITVGKLGGQARLELLTCSIEGEERVVVMLSSHGKEQGGPDESSCLITVPVICWAIDRLGWDWKGDDSLMDEKQERRTLRCCGGPCAANEPWRWLGGQGELIVIIRRYRRSIS